MTPVFSRASWSRRSHLAATAPAILSGLTSATLLPSFAKARSMSPLRLASTASFRAGSRCRMISSIVAVCMPAAWSWAKGLPASTASNCFASPTSTTRGMRSALAILSRSLAWTVDASEPSSTTRIVFAKAPRISLAPFFVSLPSATPALRARKRWSVSLSIPASDASVCTADAEGASPAMRQPFFSASVRARFSMVVFPVPA